MNKLNGEICRNSTYISAYISILLIQRFKKLAVFRNGLTQF